MKTDQKKRMAYDPDIIRIDLPRLTKALMKKAWLIIVVALLFGSGAYLATKQFVTPTYCASFTAYVTNSSEQVDYTVRTSSDVTAARSLVSTYAIILKSRDIIDGAAEEANLGMSYAQLSEAVSINAVDNTEVFQVDIVLTDPEDALAFAQALAKAAPEYVSRIVAGSSMEVITSPTLPTSIYSPNYKKNVEKGLLLGALLVIAAVVLKELLDTRAKHESELEERYGIPVMGRIPDLVEAKKYRDSGYRYGKSR